MLQPPRRQLQGWGRSTLRRTQERLFFDSKGDPRSARFTPTEPFSHRTAVLDQSWETNFLLQKPFYLLRSRPPSASGWQRQRLHCGYRPWDTIPADFGGQRVGASLTYQGGAWGRQWLNGPGSQRTRQAAQPPGAPSWCAATQPLPEGSAQAAAPPRSTHRGGFPPRLAQRRWLPATLPQLLEKARALPKEEQEERGGAIRRGSGMEELSGSARRASPDAPRGIAAHIALPRSHYIVAVGLWLHPLVHPTSLPGSLTNSHWREQVAAPLLAPAAPTITQQPRESLRATRSLKITICPRTAPRPGESRGEMIPTR